MRYISAPRSAAQYPAGVSAASCPNYPFCNLAPVSFITRKQQKQKNKKNKKKQQLPQLSLLQPRPCGLILFISSSFWWWLFFSWQLIKWTWNEPTSGPSWLWLWNMTYVNLGGASWLRQHCRLPRRSQCCCLPRISLLLNNKVLRMSEHLENLTYSYTHTGCTLCASRAPERLHNEN